MCCGLHSILWPFCLQTSELMEKLVINVPKLKSKFREIESCLFSLFKQRGLGWLIDDERHMIVKYSFTGDLL